MNKVLRHKGLLVILVVGLILRLIVLITEGSWLSIDSDDKGYISSAIEFLNGNGITYINPEEPTIHILPGITFLLSPFLVFGYNEMSMTFIKLMMIGFGLLSITFTYAIGHYLFNRYVGLIGALLLAIYIPQILSDNLVLTEGPFTAAFLGFFYFSFRLGDEPRMKWFYWVIGLYLFMLYFRPTIALLPILLLIYFILKKYPWKLAMKQFVVAAILLVLVMSPWWIRNYVHYDAFIPLSGGAGNPMLLGTYQGHGYKFTPTYKEVVSEIDAAMQGEPRYVIQEAQREVAQERMRLIHATEPEWFWETYIELKTIEQWSSPFYWIEILSVPLEKMHMIYEKTIVYLFWLSLLALVVYPKRWKEWIFVGLLIGYFTLLNNIFFAYPRYNQPLLPFLFVFASAGVIGVIQRLREYIINKNPAR